MRPKSSTHPLKVIKKRGKNEQSKDKKKIRKEEKIKEEEKIREEEKSKNEVKSEPSTRAKRQRLISAKMALFKRSGLVTRQQTRLLEELESLTSESDAGEAASGYHS